MDADAIIFDLDGTLIETEHLWDQARRGLAEKSGVSWPEEATRAMMGMSTREWSGYLADHVGIPMSPELAAQATIESMAEHHRGGLELLPGAVESVKRMAEHYRLAMASSSPRLLIDAAAEGLGIRDLLEVTVSTEEVERGKPEPDGFLRAAELLGVDPGRCVAVEDSENGILSALNAGMTVVVVPPAFEPPAQAILDRTIVLGSLDELTHELILSL